MFFEHKRVFIALNKLQAKGQYLAVRNVFKMQTQAPLIN